MSAPRWAEHYAAMRFRDGGREWPAVDCWGAVRLVLRERAGVQVESYGETPAAALASVARSMDTDAAAPPWTRVAVPRALDVVTMTGRGRLDGKQRTLVCHVGIMVSETHMLHVEASSDAAIVPLDHLSVRHRLAGFYRHDALATEAPAA